MGDSLTEADPRAAARVARARRTGKGVAVIVFIVFSVVFVGASATQIVRVVFGREGEAAPSAGPAATDGVCAEGMATLVRALDRATGSAKSAYASAIDADGAVGFFRQGLRPEWDDSARIERACATSANGHESWAALLRLREALEQWLRQESIELAPLRRDVMAHLPANLR